MYCARCGIHNPDSNTDCLCCANALAAQQYAPDQKISVDLTLFPFKAILKSMKGFNPLFLLILIPIIAAIYYVSSLFKKPFLSPILNSYVPKYDPANLNNFKRLHKKTLDPVLSYLSDQGFEQMIDLEDKSLTQGMLQRFLANQRQKIFCVLHINKATGRLQYATFFAFTSKHIYYSADNTYAIPIEYPKNIVVSHFPDKSVQQTHEAFLAILSEQTASPILISQKSVLINGCRIRGLSIEKGLQQGVLHQKIQGAATCYHHPFQAAVRLCSVCQTPICEACYTASNDQYYCPQCLSSSVSPHQPPPVIDKQTGVSFSGFGVRVLAFMIDCAVIALFAGAVFTSILTGVRLLLPGDEYQAIPFIAAQAVGIIFSIGYFIISVYKFGSTIGQKLLGLRVTDGKGNLPDVKAGIVRFAYLFFSILFVFPVIGYLVIGFKKNKQGFHDQLAGTFVVTKHPVKKAILSWIILTALVSGAALHVRQIDFPFLYLLPFFSSYTYKSEVTLEPIWVKQFNDSDRLISSTRSGNQFFYTTQTALTALDITTGNSLWNLDTLTRPITQVFHDSSAPLIAVEYLNEGGSSIIRVDPDTGTILWKIKSDLSDVSVIGDSKAVYLFNHQKIAAFDLSGSQLWEKVFEDVQSIENVILNQDILIERTTEKNRSLICLSHQTGEVIWEKKNTDYSPGLTIGNGYQSLYSDTGQTALQFIPDNQIIWESASIGYIFAFSGIPFEREKKSILFTETSAISGEHGAVLYLYPKETQFCGLTDAFLFVRKTAPSNSQAELIMIEKLSGIQKKVFQTKQFLYLTVIQEDAEWIYLGGTVRSKDGKRMTTETELIFINKQTLEIHEQPCGKNLNVHQLVVLPDSRVFIPSYDKVGMYRF